MGHAACFIYAERNPPTFLGSPVLSTKQLFSKKNAPSFEFKKEQDDKPGYVVGWSSI
jgi:hypothetical protein